MLFRRRARPPGLEPERFDMTPLIDCTFQLIVFFMLVTDMSARQNEELTLPAASRLVETEEPEIVVNVLADRRVRVSGRTYSDAALEALFESVRPRLPGQGKPVLIRADRSARFEDVQKVMMIAHWHGNLTRVHFGAKFE